MVGWMNAIKKRVQMKKLSRYFVCLFLLTFVYRVACSQESPSEQLPANVTGKWTLFCNDPNGTTSTKYLDLKQNGAQIKGHFKGTYQSGGVEGTINGRHLVVRTNTRDEIVFRGRIDGPKVNGAVQGSTLYKQFQVILAASTATVVANACGSSASCVVLASDSSVHALEISDEATIGILISPGQSVPGQIVISGFTGGFTTAANHSKTLDINFLACESIVRDEQGNYRIRPVVNAGEVRTSSHGLRGKVLDGGTGQPVKGSVMIALERPDVNGTDRVMWATLAEADGSFIFCPLAVGAYDVVIVGTGSDGTFYEPSVLHYVGESKNIGSVKLYPLPPASASFVTLAGKIVSQSNSHAGVVLDVKVSVIEHAGDIRLATIPMSPTSGQSSATVNVVTAPSNGALTCQANTYCAAYSIQVPAGSINYANFQTDGTHLSSNATLPTYAIDGVGSLPSSGGMQVCNRGFPFRTPPFTPSAGGVTVPVPALNITHCP